MRIYVAGHRGLVGSAIAKRIESEGTHEWFGATRSEVNLLDRNATFDFVAAQRPDAVVVAAAKVGGIRANSTYPVEFLSENLQIETNLIDASHAAGVPKLLFLGSSCIYPKLCSQPIREEYLLTGPLEPTNEPYALAKIAGLKLVQSYRRQYGHSWISAMPTNLYGPGDNFDLENSHVLPALIRRFHEAKLAAHDTITLWGTGTPRREFLHADDLASASLFLLENYDSEVAINVGVGQDLEIRELAALIAGVVGFEGQIAWDTSRPDGTPRKLLDTSLINSLGWRPRITLEEGIQQTYRWYRESLETKA